MDNYALSFPYDYNSIMHYETRAYAIDTTKDTIKPLQECVSIGLLNENRLSDIDIKEIRFIYQCGVSPTSSTTTTTKTTSSKLTSSVKPTANSGFSFWQDGLNSKHFFQKSSNTSTNNWIEVDNSTVFSTLTFVSQSASVVKLFASDRNFYIELSCGQATWGLTSSQANLYKLSSGFWINPSAANSCLCPVLTNITTTATTASTKG